MSEQRRNDIRNVAIIAHIDHGKTTLVDGILEVCEVFRENQARDERVLDSNALEKERGITIKSKNISVEYKGVKINLIDTPGHADFGGEVERVLRMADGVLLLVDAVEGPMPQTTFVLRKALEAGLTPCLVVNKIDRPESRLGAVEDEVLELFIDLGADEHQIEFPTVYASARDRLAKADPDDPDGDLTVLLDAILEHIPGPIARIDEPFRMQISKTAYDNYVGKIAIGRIHSGSINTPMQDTVAHRDGKSTDNGEVRTLYTFNNLGRTETESSSAGDIAAVVGLPNVEIGDTVCDPEHINPLPVVEIDEPTLSMTFQINDSPFAGQSGKYVTSRQVRDRLEREMDNDVALKVTDTDRPEVLNVSGRGTMHLGILIEEMRREGYEFQVGRPQVIVREIDGVKCEPIELLVVDVPNSVSGKVMELLGNRKAEMISMESRGERVIIQFHVPARGLIGIRTRLLNATGGEAIMYHTFHEYGPHKGEVGGRTRGALISMESGRCTAYAVEGLSDRGILFSKPGDQVYLGQVVGEHNRDNDIEVNVCRTKKLTNMRASGSDSTVVLTPPKEFGLEEALEYIRDDELLEVTPDAFRIRKKILTESERRRTKRLEKKDA
jgi:GTP-binding protein